MEVKCEHTVLVKIEMTADEACKLKVALGNHVSSGKKRRPYNILAELYDRLAEEEVC